MRSKVHRKSHKTAWLPHLIDGRSTVGPVDLRAFRQKFSELHTCLEFRNRLYCDQDEYEPVRTDEQAGSAEGDERTNLAGRRPEPAPRHSSPRQSTDSAVFLLFPPLHYLPELTFEALLPFHAKCGISSAKQRSDYLVRFQHLELSLIAAYASSAAVAAVNLPFLGSVPKLLVTCESRSASMTALRYLSPKG